LFFQEYYTKRGGDFLLFFVIFIEISIAFPLWAQIREHMFFDPANGCFSSESGRKIFFARPEPFAVGVSPNSAIGSVTRGVDIKYRYLQNGFDMVQSH
jgi:hypothetical protein